MRDVVRDAVLIHGLPGLDDTALALAADGWTCRSCGKRVPSWNGKEDPHREDECLVRQVMEE